MSDDVVCGVVATEDAPMESQSLGGEKRSRDCSPAVEGGTVGGVKLSRVSDPPLIGAPPSGESADRPFTVFLIHAVSGAAIFSNPSKVSRAVDASHFGQYCTDGHGEVECTGGGKTLVVRLRAADVPQVVPPMEEVSTLGEWEVRCRRVRDLQDASISYGTIGPVDREFSTEELLRGLRVLQGFGAEASSTLLEAYRLPASFPGPHDPPKSLYIRLMFKGPLPIRLRFASMSFLVSAYHFPMLRCYDCHQFGHGSASCRSSVRCSMCSGAHRFRSGEGVKCALAPFCYLCLGDHRVVSRACPIYGRAVEIHRTVREDGMSVQAVNRELRALPAQFRRSLAAHRVSAAPPGPSMSSRPASATVRGPHLSPPPRPPPLSLANRFSPLATPADESEVAQPRRRPSSPRPVSYSHAVRPRPPRERAVRHPSPRPRRSDTWGHSGWSDVPSDASVPSEPGVPPRRPLDRPSFARSSSFHPSPLPHSPLPHPPPGASAPSPSISLEALLRLLMDAISSYLAGVSPVDICEQFMPRLLGLSVSS